MASIAIIRMAIGCRRRPFLQLFTTVETECNFGKSYLISQRSFGGSFLQIPALNFNYRKYSSQLNVPLSLRKSHHQNVPASNFHQGNLLGLNSWNENPLIRYYSNVSPSSEKHPGKTQKPPPVPETSKIDKNIETSSNTKLDDNPAIVLPPDVEPEKMGLVAKFKMMYKQYWYVLVPVHIITSTGWMVGFYYLSQSGVDIPAMMEYLRISDTVIQKIQNSTMGHLAIAYMCYKLITPLRYMVTIGGTTLSIKYLSQWGYIKPMPSKEQIRKMYDARKAQFKRGYEEMQEKRQEKMAQKTSKNVK